MTNPTGQLTRRRRKKRDGLPATLDELVGALEVMPPAATPSAVDQTLLPTLRSPRVPREQAEAATAVAERLRDLDPTWRARLLLALESFGESGSDAAKRLQGPLITQAREAVGFPSAADDALDGWIRSQQSEWTTTLSLAPVVICLLPLADQPWWSRVVINLLRRWSGGELSVDPPKPNELRKAMTLIGPDARPARGALALVQAEIAAHVGTKKKLADATGHRDRLVQTNQRLSAEKQRFAVEGASLRERLDALEADVRRLEEEAERTRRDARQEVAQSVVHGDNRLGRLAFRVTNVLDRETEEMKLYLERSEPNVAGALRRIGELERLRDEVRAIRDEGETG